MLYDYCVQVEVVFFEFDDIEDDGFCDRVREVWCFGFVCGGW